MATPRTLLIVLFAATAVVCSPAQAAQTFANSGAITINDSPGGVAQPATPYPSEIAVSRVSGAVTAVTATLHGFHDKCPQDVDVLLVGPLGDTVLLMSDAGDCVGDDARVRIDLTFDDSATSAAPCESDGSEMPGGTYRPADWPDHDCTTENPDFSDSFPAPAPGGPWPTSLGGFAGKDPNGTWSLYVVDDQGDGAGAIDGGWSLAISTTPPAPPPPASPKPPTLSSTTHRIQNVEKTRGVLVSFSSSSGGELRASGTVSVPKLAKTYRFRSFKKQVPAGAVRVQLRLPRAALDAIRHALKRHRKLSARITLGLTAPDGLQTSKRLLIRLK